MRKDDGSDEERSPDMTRQVTRHCGDDDDDDDDDGDDAKSKVGGVFEAFAPRRESATQQHEREDARATL